MLVANDDDYATGIAYSERVIKESLSLMKRLDLPLSTLDAVSTIVIGQVGASVAARFEAAQREKQKLANRYIDLTDDLAPVAPRQFLQPVPTLSGQALATKPPRSPWDMTVDELKAEIAKLEANAKQG